MDKKVQLALNFKDAPEAIKTTVTAYGKAEKELALAESKLVTATKAVADARLKAAELEKAFNAELNAWTPATGA